MPWVCREGHRWEASPYKVLRRGHGCPFCANRQVWTGWNDLKTTHPGLAREASGWDPTAVVAGSGKRVTWICSAAHEWTAVVRKRALGGHGCPECSERTLRVGYTDLASRVPDIATEADGWDPSRVHWGSRSRRAWTCGVGHRWVQSVSVRTKQGTGCPDCAAEKQGRESAHKPAEGPWWTRYSALRDEAELAGHDARGVRQRTPLPWVCETGHHRWVASVEQRIRGATCPECRRELTTQPGLSLTRRERVTGGGLVDNSVGAALESFLDARSA